VWIASYGSLARFPDVKRLRRFNNKAVLGFGGDVSDMQYIDRLLDALAIRENYAADNSTEEQPNAMNARNLYIYLSKVMYQRRSDFDPLWNHIIVAGLDEDNKPFLASVDLLGTTFSAPSLATGYGSYLAQPILRKTVPDEEAVANVDEEEAEHAIQESMKVLFYRDARSLPTYSIALVTEEGGVELMEDQTLENQSWAFADRIKGYGTQTK
jgi:20S proteasome subunit beta 7